MEEDVQGVRLDLDDVYGRVEEESVGRRINDCEERYRDGIRKGFVAGLILNRQIVNI